jgi:hypothetical protein
MLASRAARRARRRLPKRSPFRPWIDRNTDSPLAPRGAVVDLVDVGPGLLVTEPGWLPYVWPPRTGRHSPGEFGSLRVGGRADGHDPRNDRVFTGQTGNVRG